MNDELISEAPCSVCGGMVLLLSSIYLTEEHDDGSATTERVTEAKARKIMAAMGVEPPPVMCAAHASAGVPAGVDA